MEITITGRDLSGPAFSSAMTHITALRGLVRGLKQDLRELGMPGLDASKMQSSLLLLKSKIQSLHIADLADVNVQPGLIMTQLNLLKRLIQQAGISDILDVNLNQGKLNAALANIASMSETIPVNFDIKGLNELKSALSAKDNGFTIPVRYLSAGGPSMHTSGESIPVKFKPDLSALNDAINTVSHIEETIPVKFDVGSMPHVGGGGFGVDSSTLASWAALNNETYKLSAGLGDLSALVSSVNSSFSRASERVQQFGTYISNSLTPYLTGDRVAFEGLIDSAGRLGGHLQSGLGSALKGVNGLLLDARGHYYNVSDAASNLGHTIGQALEPEILGARVAFDHVTEAAQKFGLSVKNGVNPYILGSKMAFQQAKNPLIDLALIMGSAKDKASVFSGVIRQGLSTSLSTLGSLFVRAKNSVGGMGSTIASAIGNAGGGLTGLMGLGTAFGIAGNRAGRFGGILGGTFAGIALWHIALDGILEAVIAVTLALLAAAPAVSVFVNVGKDLATNLQSQHVLFESMGQTIGPLTGKFDELAHAMAPQVIEVYGGALRIMTSQTGVFGDAVVRVSHVFDTWMAKISIFATGLGLKKFLSSGVGYLSQFGQIIGNVGLAISGLLSKDPGIAHYLLDIVNATVLLLKAFTALPGPVVEGVLVLHGLYLWGKVMAGLLMPIALGLVNMGKSAAGIIGPMLGLSTASGRVAGSFLGMSAISWSWIGVVAIAIGGLVYEMSRASAASKEFINGINQQISNDNASTAILDIGSAVGQLSDKILQVPGVVQHGFDPLNHATTSAGKLLEDAAHRVVAQKGTWSNFSAIIGDVGGAFGMLGKAAGDYIPNVIGVQQASNATAAYKGEIVSLTDQQNRLFRSIGSLIKQGYSYSASLALLDMAGVQASDSFAVMKAKVDNLVKGYENIIGKGGALNNSIQAVNFAALQQQSQVDSLNKGWDAFTGTLSGGESGLLTFSDSLKEMADAAKKSGRNFGTLSFAITDSTTKQSNLTSTFQNAYTNANAYADKLTLLASASGGGADKAALLNTAVKDLVKLLLPAASGSKTLTAELYGLAQRGGYTGADSFKQLSKWVGNTKSPMTQLDKITQTMTVDAANLITDVKNLSIALGTNLNQAMAAAIFQASGGQKVFDNFANAILHTGTKSDVTRQAAGKLAISLYNQLGQNVNLTKSEFETFAQYGLGRTKSEADKLWQQTLPNLQRAINNLHGKKVSVEVAGIGSGGFAITGTGLAQGSGSIRIRNFAGGGRVPGGWAPGHDNQMSLTSPGEFILVPEAARALGYGNLDSFNRKHAHGRHSSGAGAPMFAGGGFTPGSFNPNGLPGVSGAVAGIELPMAMKAVASEVRSSVVAFKNKLLGAEKAMLAGSGSDIVSYAASFMGKIPYVWGGTSLSSRGADCSGFTGSVLRHFGYNPPRTSEAQGNWVHRSPPTPGGLAFYHSPAGGPDPGHVAIVAGGGQVISQGGGMGPRVQRLNFLPLLWTGVPPGGFSGGAGGASTGTGASRANGGSPAQNAALARSMYPAWSQGFLWNDWNYLENREAGWNQFARNPSSGAYGIPQALPYTKMPRPAWPNWAGGISSPFFQIQWMHDYMQSVYGGPVGAAFHEAGFGWYGGGGPVFDNGGWLKPGWNPPTYNGTGAPEHLVPSGHGGGITLEIVSSGNSDFDAFMFKWIKTCVRVKGGGNVQNTFGRH